MADFFHTLADQNSLDDLARRLGVFAAEFHEMEAELLPDPLYDLYTGRYFEIKKIALQAGVDPDIRKDEFGGGTVGVVKYEPSNLVVGRIHFHNHVLDIGFALGVHPNDLGSLQEGLRRKPFKLSELSA
jgi:hypothetical protein